MTKNPELKRLLIEKLREDIKNDRIREDMITEGIMTSVKYIEGDIITPSLSPSDTPFAVAHEDIPKGGVGKISLIREV